MAIGILVKNIMSKPAVKINYNKTVQEAAKQMVKYRVGSIIVVKKKSPIKNEKTSNKKDPCRG